MPFRYWVFGEQFCDTWVACDVMCSTASILNLCAISLDRYIHIKDPLRYVLTIRYIISINSIKIYCFCIFTLYPAHINVGRGNLIV